MTELTEYRINQLDVNGEVLDMYHRDTLEEAKELAEGGLWLGDAEKYSIDKMVWNDQRTEFTETLDVVEPTVP